MVKVLAVVALLVVLQIIPSCGGPKPTSDDSSVGTGRPAVVVGWVDEKRTDQQETLLYVIIINSRIYGVPYLFWREVSVGDLVKYDGEVWRIVRKAKP